MALHTEDKEDLKSVGNLDWGRQEMVSLNPA